jgi:XTP/dITP diphosphohydrolase
MWTKDQMNINTHWVVASHNKGKIKELGDILKPYRVKLSSAADFQLAAPEETEKTFVGNAILKARAACLSTGLPCLADDSGLAVDALDGQPGVYSARWAGEDQDFTVAMNRVHEALSDKPTDDWTARFVCVVALARPDGSVSRFEGEIEGEIVWPPRGCGGFGYDPIFQPHRHRKVFAEMTRKEKAALSHRGRALSKLVASEFAK